LKTDISAGKIRLLHVATLCHQKLLKKGPPPPKDLPAQGFKAGAEPKSLKSRKKNIIMSAYTLTKEGEIITGFDGVAPVQWCTPRVLGCSACISATASGGAVTITITANTPLGSFSKSFTFSNNICYTWNPVSRVSITPCIGNFAVSEGKICFTLSIKLCVNLIIRKICTPTFSNQFCVPLPGNTENELLAKGEVTDEQAVHALLLEYLMEKAGSGSHGCNCER
jgi:hypothetical protein